MIKREDCTCTCHTSDPEIIHFVPCCDDSCGGTKKELLEWIEKYPRYGWPVEKHLKNKS